MKKHWIMGLSALAILATCGGVSTLNVSAAENNEQPQSVLTQLSPTMIGGASVRLVQGSYGIRFGMTLTETEYQKAEAANVQYGMLILPADYYKANPFTESIFTGSDVYYFRGQEGSVETNGKKAIDNLTADYLSLTEYGYTLYGSITNIVTDNMVRPFMGIGYIAVEENGKTNYKFATTVEGENVRSMAYVAQKALETGKYTGTNHETALNDYLSIADDYGAYYTVVHHTENKDGTYTEYSREQKVARINSALTEEDVKIDVEGYTYGAMTEVKHVLADDKTVVNVYYEDNDKQDYAYENLGEHKVAVALKKVSGANAGLQATWKPTTTDGLLGYGISFNFDSKTYHYIYHIEAGTIARLVDFNHAWLWGDMYRAPSEYGVTVTKNDDGSVTSLFPFTAALGEAATMESVKVCLFNYVSTTGDGVKYGYADCMQVGGVYSDFTNTATYDTWNIYNVTQPDPDPNPEPEEEQVLSTYNVAAFGKTNATAKFEKVSGPKNGIRVTITYTPATGFWGFGVMLSDGKSGITQLYVPGYGTIDHRVYGNWAWEGNYVAASALGVEAIETVGETQTVITLFYSYETLQSQNYGLNINADTAEISLNMFEYVTDSSGSQYACYNGMKNEQGTEILVDCGIAGFIKWNTANE